MTPDHITEQAGIEASRAQRAELERLNASFASLDEEALKFDSDPEYRAELKARIVGQTETTEWRVAA